MVDKRPKMEIKGSPTVESYADKWRWDPDIDQSVRVIARANHDVVLLAAEECVRLYFGTKLKKKLELNTTNQVSAVAAIRKAFSKYVKFPKKWEFTCEIEAVPGDRWDGGSDGDDDDDFGEDYDGDSW